MLERYERAVQYYETDQMGIVHHSNYARWFEEARCFILDKAGLPYAKMEENGVLVPVLSVSATFRRYFKYGDIFSLHVAITKFNGVKMEVSYKVYNKASGELCTEGCSSHCFVKSDMKPFNMKKEMPEMYDTIYGLLNSSEI